MDSKYPVLLLILAGNSTVIVSGVQHLRTPRLDLSLHETLGFGNDIHARCYSCPISGEETDVEVLAGTEACVGSLGATLPPLQDLRR